MKGGRQLISCDVNPTCYFDRNRATGEAARQLYRAPRTTWHLETNKTARDLSDTMAPGSVDLTFIDANHAHPWPLVDLLQATAFAKPESWMVLHDIELPVMRPEFQDYGAKWLFDF